MRSEQTARDQDRTRQYRAMPACWKCQGVVCMCSWCVCGGGLLAAAASCAGMLGHALAYPHEPHSQALTSFDTMVSASLAKLLPCRSSLHAHGTAAACVYVEAAARHILEQRCSQAPVRTSTRCARAQLAAGAPRPLRSNVCMQAARCWQSVVLSLCYCSPISRQGLLMHAHRIRRANGSKGSRLMRASSIYRNLSPDACSTRTVTCISPARWRAQHNVFSVIAQMASSLVNRASCTPCVGKGAQRQAVALQPSELGGVWRRPVHLMLGCFEAMC